MLLFIASTFTVNLILLNMLIAIMGDTFDYVTENRDVILRRILLRIMCDTFSQTTTEDKKRVEDYRVYTEITQDIGEYSDKNYFYVVEPIFEDDKKSDDWSGSNQSIKKFIDNNLNKKIDVLAVEQNRF